MKFKFKVWDKIKNTWIVDPKINAKGKYIGQTSEAGRFEVRPYIGLKDKHSNEIYLNDDFRYKNAKLTVDFKNGAFGYHYAGLFVSFCVHIDEGDFTIIDDCIQELIKE